MKIELFGTLIDGSIWHLLSKDQRSVSIQDDCRDVSDFVLGCMSLELVEFGSASRMVSIGKETFAHTSIKNLMIPTKCEQIGFSTFVRCDIEIVYVQAGNTSLRGHECSSICKLLTSPQ